MPTGGMLLPSKLDSDTCSERSLSAPWSRRRQRLHLLMNVYSHDVDFPYKNAMACVFTDLKHQCYTGPSQASQRKLIEMVDMSCSSTLSSRHVCLELTTGTFTAAGSLRF